MRPDTELIKIGLKCQCPKCHKGHIFKSKYSLELLDRCPECALDLQKNDSADGPAVFMIFILGFLLVPLALILDAYVTIPLWGHAILWSIIALGMTIGALKPLKAYILGLQYKHRPEDWS